MLHSFFTFFAAPSGQCNGFDFLGLRPWYHYINDAAHFNHCEIKKFKFLPPGSDVPLVLLAIVDDLLRVAALVAIAYVIVGAIKYITSQGNPEASAQAQSTVINALIGLAIAMIAIVFVSFIGGTLG